MQLTLSPGAISKIQAKGGEVAVDFIAPVGCGKVSEVDISTNLKGRDTSGYIRITQDGVSIYMAQDLLKHVHELEVIVQKGLIGSKLLVRTPNTYGTTC